MPESVADRFASILGRKVAAVERIGGGRNSVVYKLLMEHGPALVGKLYHRHPGDSRDRAQTEYASIRFMRSGGIANVPVPVLLTSDHHAAVYEHVAGASFPSDTVTQADIKTVASWLLALQDLRSSVEARKLPNASDAFFSIREVAASVEGRAARLEGAGGVPNAETDTVFRELASFMAESFRPALRRAVSRGRDIAQRKGFLYDEPISFDHRVISPSDVGFHNILKRADGSFVFFDFEYFGWDDAAKLIADFVLHPAMNNSADLNSLYVTSMLDGLAWIPHLRDRLDAVLPLFALKWCTILLNEFIPADLDRRLFSLNEDSSNVYERRQVQLLKARRMLVTAEDACERFPY